MFKRIDQYLLNNFPAAWVTRFHIFIPIGIALFLIIFGVNLMIPWNPKNDLPRSEAAIVITIIPVLVYLVYWFIFQSRYNVIKSKGRTSFMAEYGNFSLYLLLFLTACVILFAVPMSNYQRVKNSVSAQQLEADREAMDLGYSLITASSINVKDGIYTYYRYDFVSYYDYYDYESIYHGSDLENEISVNRDNAIKIIKNFITAYNKYTHYPIYRDAEDIFNSIEVYDYNSGEYYNEDYYNNGFYLDSEWEVQWKVSELCERAESGEWMEEFNEPWFWKILFAFAAFLALLVHIFKQAKLRQFIFAFISICLTPLLFVIVGVLIFEVIRIDNYYAEDLIPVLFLIWYLIAAVLFIQGYVKNRRNNLGYIAGIYFHFILPLLPMVLYLVFFDENRYWYDWEYTANLLYYSCWIVGLTSIGLFRNVYKKFYHIPGAK